MSHPIKHDYDYVQLLNDLRRCLALCYDTSRSIFDLSNVQKHLQLSTEYMVTHSIVPNLLTNATVSPEVIPYEFEVERYRQTCAALEYMRQNPQFFSKGAEK